MEYDYETEASIDALIRECWGEVPTIRDTSDLDFSEDLDDWAETA